jgi:hypothetical protein
MFDLNLETFDFLSISDIIDRDLFVKWSVGI